MAEKKEEEVVIEQPDEQVVLTMADIAALGLGKSVEEVTVKLKEAQKARADNVTLTSLAQELIKSQTEFSDLIRKATAEKQAEHDSDKFDELTRSKMAEKFASFDREDPKRKELYDALRKDYGTQNTELVLAGNAVTKTLMRPLGKNVPNVEEIKDFRDGWDNAYMLTAIWGGVSQHGKGNDTAKIDWELMLDAAKTLEKQGMVGMDTVNKAINQAMDTQTATEGLEWLPTILSGTMAEDLWLSLKVASLFKRYTMPSKTFDVPTRTSRALGYRMAEATTNSQFFTNLATAHSMNTSKVTFTAQKLATLNFISDELEEDAILPVLSMMREDVIYGLNYCIEDAVLNGSTGATLDGSLWTGTTDARSTWNGIRSAINTAEKTDLSTFNLNGLRNMRKPMYKYSSEVEKLVYIVAPWTHIELLKLAEVVTMDKLGPHATVLSGQIGVLDGIPIVVSPLVYGPGNAAGLNASGVYDGSTTTKTIMLLVNTMGWAFGDRRTVRVESERQALAGQRFVLSTWRGDFKKTFAAAEQLAALGYNMTP